MRALTILIIIATSLTIVLSVSCKKSSSPKKTTGIDGYRNWHHYKTTYTTIIDTVTLVTTRTTDSTRLPDDQSTLDSKRQDLIYAHGYAPTDSFLSCQFYSSANTLSVVDYYPSKDSIVLYDQTTQTTAITGSSQVKMEDINLTSYTY